MNRRQIIVAGFHRSGTSLVAQLLQRSGLFMGNELLGANPTNVHGHVEDRGIVRLHDEILTDNKLTWQVDSPVIPEVREQYRRRAQQIIDKREAEREVWGFKDPRVCLFMDTWKSLLPDAKVLIVYRSPVQTTASLHKRAATGLARGRGNRKFHSKFREVPDLALKMWLTHNNRLLDFVNSHSEDVMILSFDMLRRGFPLVSVLNERWRLGLEEIETPEVFDPDVTTESEKRLPVADKEFIDETLETWGALQRLGRESESLLENSVSDGSLIKNSFREAEGTYDLLIENEFQNFRVEFLQHRTQELEQSQKELQEELEQVRKCVVSPQRKRELEVAERDLTLVLTRLSNSTAAPIFRLKKGFRNLERKYLGNL